jgi:hypothetical protein
MMGGVGSPAGVFFFFFDMAVYWIITGWPSVRAYAAESIAQVPFIFLQLIDSFTIVINTDHRQGISICCSRHSGWQI